MKINFTKDHFEKLKELLSIMLLNNETVNNRLGIPVNVVELVHTTSLNSLNDMRNALKKTVEKAESADEWVSSFISQEKVNKLRRQIETIYLIIGYKRYQMELADLNNKRNELTEKLNKMKEEAKTPEEKIKEVQNELDNLEIPENNMNIII